MDIIGVASITAICYLVGDAVKSSGLKDKWVPTIVGFTGLVLGVAAYLIGVDAFPANDVLTAAAVGVVSGLASTGANQVVKQLTKGADK